MVILNYERLLEHIGKEVKVGGWVESLRLFKKICFVVLRSFSNRIQVTVKYENLLEICKNLSIGDSLIISGIVNRKESKDEDPLSKIEIVAKDIKIVNKSKVFPIDIRNPEKITEENKIKYRWIYLKAREVSENIIFRFKVVNSFRKHLIEEGFVEIETPYLTKSVPEGSRDFLVPSRLYSGKFYALAQSPQIYKQLLIISGFYKYFQIARCFRDEDPRADRQPEFTQVDIEMAFVDESDVISFITSLVKRVVKEILGVTLDKFQIFTYEEVMERYGSDKPDLRIPFEIRKAEFDERVRYFEVDKSLGKKELCEIERFIKKVEKDYGVKIEYKLGNKEKKGEILEDLLRDTKSSLVFSIRLGENKYSYLEALGKVRDFIGKLLGYKDVKEYKVLWIVDFPMFEFNEDSGEIVPKHHPFTQPKDVSLLDENPLEVKAKSYDLVINGYEVAGGSIRINDRRLQEKIFKMMGMSEEEMNKNYGYLLEALEYGAPPHGGIAFGLERFLATLKFKDNIREFIAFPKMSNWKDPLTGAPAEVPKKYLEDTIIPLCKRLKEFKI